MFGFMVAAVVTTNAFSSPVDGWGAVMKMLSALLIVLGLMGFLTYLIRRYYPGLRGARDAGPSIRVLGTVYLGSKRTIAVIGIQNKRLVVGMTPSSMTLLASLEGEGENASMNLEAREEKRPLSFAKIFKHQFMRKTEETP